ncbi:MAG: kinase [Candidatus Micrarchaeia archaeon]
MNDGTRFITTKTPVRISFTGGGTDFPAFYRQNGGAVISAAINKYIYVTVAKNFYKDEIRVSYSKTENALKSVEEIQHPTVREAMKLLGIQGGLQIISITEIPSQGTGLGSSSSFLVGLLNALHAWQAEAPSQRQLAEEAFKIEREILKEPGGKQDHYMAAYGGMNLLEFFPDDSTNVKQILLKKEAREEFQENLLLLYTGRQRESSTIHTEQQQKVGEHIKEYEEMKNITYETYEALARGDYASLGSLLDRNWKLKRRLANGITDPKIDEWYDTAMRNGAEGGKLIGAGGGGFMLFYAKKEYHERIKNALPELQEIKFSFEPFGSRIIYIED